jgi:hypothetical protein
MKLLKYGDYSQEVITEEFLRLLSENSILEGKKIDPSKIDEVLRTLSRDLKFNLGLVFTFGTGVKVIYPIVNTFIENGLIKVEPTVENIVLICITTLTIIYLEEKNNKSGDQHIECDVCHGKDNSCDVCHGHGHIISQVTKADAQTLLTELKMRGVGNGVIKNLVKLFHKVGDLGKTLIDGIKKAKSIGSTFFRNIPVVIDGFLDMIGYTQLLIPILNAISVLSGTYNLTWDNLWTNLATIGGGLLTLFARRQYQKAWDYIKNIGNFDIPKDPNQNNVQQINEQ